ncbi:hypothetical protein OAN307_c14600 [Octadecabacter antarcticus 307]|uniref:YjiS-like domain-containing protein n=1 Tax=Octadecabacter antarcticus 307 TaxID=391626 RepID=M9R9S4_9RHOB|nr:DUF1127 domain-containing protein [Octadecabacter antarcticus]AGI67136.1 hypothetical protein OAN307_c14600 [Octadecabacter antarcticus 307]
MTFTLNPTRNRSSRNSGTVHMPSIATVFAVWTQRRALANLDDARLKDLGISPQDAAIEAARPFWDLPKRLCH